jgi:ribosomal 50S subunit-recycling heat shock protein
MTVLTIPVKPGDAGARLDRWFKRHYPTLTQGALQKMLRSGQIRVDGKRAEAATRVNEGQEIRVPPMPSAPPPIAVREPDEKDAAELAADEAGVAIYQVETLPEGSGEIGEVSVRFRDTTSGEMVERAWTIPHDPTTPAFDKAASQTQLATLALLAAQKLQGGPLADAIRFGDHAETIAKLKQAYANDAKAQRLLTLINALR